VIRPQLSAALGAADILALAPTRSAAGDFFDTRVTFAFADDNVLANSGETNPNSPTAGFGASAQNTQFFDNFNTRFSGFETLSNITLYKKSASFFEHFEAEAGLSILVLENASGTIGLRDNSSYVKLNFRPAGWGAKEDISFTGFPVTSDRFRLGYAWRITWGGNSAFTNGALQDGVPGAKLQITRDRWYAFAGMKTGLLLNNLIQEKERLYGGLVGGGVEIVKDMLRLEANGGYFQRGIVPGLANQGIRAPVNAGGVSSQLSFYRGDAIQPSVDLRLYKNDPDVLTRFFRPESYPGGLSFQFSVEGSFLAQSLEDPDTFPATKIQTSGAVALQGRVKYNKWRFSLLALYRTLSFIQFDVPGIPPFKDFTAGTKLTPEMFAAIGADYHFEKIHLTVGGIFGVQQPAAFRSPSTSLGGNNPPPSLTGDRTVVVRDVNLFEILPTGFEAIPIISAKATLKFDISEYFAAIGEVFYTRDANRTTFRDDLAGIAQPTFQKEHQLGFNTVIQARF
jgi:hypothetical protein